MRKKDSLIGGTDMVSKKIVTISATLVLVVAALVASVLASPSPIMFQDGEMVVHANVARASDGHTYRVMVTDIVDKKSLQPWRVADAYSVDGSEYASITGEGEIGKPWTKLSACSKEEVRNSLPCRRTDQAEATMNELIAKVTTRGNHIGNFELYWSWEMGTKELIAQIKK